MASLADELDLDPAFHAMNLTGQAGVPMSLDQEEEEGDGHASIASSSSPPTRRRGSLYARRGRASSSANGSVDQASIRGAAEGFSLADELDGGPVDGGHTRGMTLADDLDGGGPLSIDEELNRAHTSHPSLIHNHEMDEGTRARRDQEHYLVSSEALNDSIRQTDAFLSKLRMVADTTSAGASLPSRASTNSVGAVGTAYNDDTSGIETAMANIVRQLREHTGAREDQVRELQEYDRIIRRAFEEGGEHLMALAEVEGAAREDDSNEDDAILQAQPEEQDPLGIATATDMIMKRRRARHGSAISNGSGPTMDEDESTMMSATSPSYDKLVDQTVVLDESVFDAEDARSTPSAFRDLILLQQSTTQLVGSLANIHEHTQIAHASMGDATRIMRNIRNVLSNWQSEVHSQEQSRAWIAAWEADRQHATNDSTTHTGTPKDIRLWTQGEMAKFERILDEAHAKARELLMPIKDPFLDRLAATSKA